MKFSFCDMCCSCCNEKVHLIAQWPSLFMRCVLFCCLNEVVEGSAQRKISSCCSEGIHVSAKRHYQDFFWQSVVEAGTGSIVHEFSLCTGFLYKGLKGCLVSCERLVHFVSRHAVRSPGLEYFSSGCLVVSSFSGFQHL